MCKKHNGENIYSGVAVRSTAISFLQYNYQMHSKHTVQGKNFELLYTVKEYVCSLLKMIERWFMTLSLSSIHSQPCLFVLACTRLTPKKLWAIYYVQYKFTTGFLHKSMH